MRRWRPPMASSRHLHRCQPRKVTAPFSSSPSWSQLDGRGHPASRRPLPCSTHTAPAPFPSSHRWQVGWADMYPIMGYSGPIRIGPSIKIISIFSDTLWIHIHGVSGTYPYQIRVQRVSAFQVTYWCCTGGEMNKTRSHLHEFLRILHQLNFLYIYICLYLQYILNSIFTFKF
jgi:hypothetical protein